MSTDSESPIVKVWARLMVDPRPGTVPEPVESIRPHHPQFRIRAQQTSSSPLAHSASLSISMLEGGVLLLQDASNRGRPGPWDIERICSKGDGESLCLAAGAAAGCSFEPW